VVSEQSRLADTACAVADVAPAQRRQRGFLVRTAFALVSTSFLTSGLGFVYWAVSARLFPPPRASERAPQPSQR
jgi:hypothetical protein